MWNFQTSSFNSRHHHPYSDALKMTISINVVLLLSIASSFLLWLTRRPSKKNLPPGPDHQVDTHNMPLSQAAREYIKMGKIYGDVFLVETGIGEKVLVLNSAKAANELFDKRSDKYSSRPYNPLILDLGSEGFATTHMAYGSRYRNYRKVMGLAVKPNMLASQRNIVRRALIHQMELLVSEPDAWWEMCPLYAARLGSIIVSAETEMYHTIIQANMCFSFLQTYGRDIDSLDDYMVAEIRRINEEFFGSLDDFKVAPILKRFPWLVKIPFEFQWKREALTHSRQEEKF